VLYLNHFHSLIVTLGEDPMRFMGTKGQIINNYPYFKVIKFDYWKQIDVSIPRILPH